MAHTASRIRGRGGEGGGCLCASARWRNWFLRVDAVVCAPETKVSAPLSARRSLMIITDASAEEVHVLSQIHWIILIVTHVEVTLIGVVSNLREPLVVGH